MARTGITTNTPNRLIIDAGQVWKNYGEVDAAIIGATRGGNTFAIEQEIHKMDFDGARGDIRGDKRKTGIMAKITANFVELTAATLNMALSGATTTDQTTYDEIVPDLDIAVGDYITNIAIVGDTTVNGNTVPVIVIVKNALAGGNMDLGFNDKDETVLTVEFTAHFLPSDLTAVPVEIRWPKES